MKIKIQTTDKRKSSGVPLRLPRLSGFAIVLFAALFIGAPAAGKAQSGRGHLLIPKKGNVMIFVPAGSRRPHLFHYRHFDSRLMKQIRKLASGRRISTAADDPSGLAVAERLKSAADELKRRGLNEEDLANYLRVADGALAQIGSALQRIRGLIVRSGSPAFSREDKEIIQGEIAQLVRQIDDIRRNAEFNRIRIFKDFAVKLGGINVVKDFPRSLRTADSALKKAMKKRALLGARRNRAFAKIDGMNYYFLNIRAGEARIRDADIARETIVLKKNWIQLKVNLSRRLNK